MSGRALTVLVAAGAFAASVVLACSDSSSTSDGGVTTTTPEGGATPDADVADSALSEEASLEQDAGPPPFGAVPEAPPTVYDCTNELHVATTGNDPSNDGSAMSPYKTIAYAASLAQAGDCIRVHTGTYAETTPITFAEDGTALAPIVLSAADGKGTVTIDTSGISAPAAIEVAHDYVTIDGFVLSAPETSEMILIRFDGTYADKGDGSVLRNTKLTGGLSQLKIYQRTKNVLVEHNEIAGKSGSSPVSLTGASGLVFRANYLHDLDSGGTGTTELAGGSTDVLFEKNLFQDIASSAGALVLGDACGDTCDNDPEHYGAVRARAINNLFIRAQRPFDVLGCKDCAVLANTIIDSGKQNLIFKISNANTNGTTRATKNLRVYNNLVTSPRGTIAYLFQIDPGSDDGILMDQNLFYNGPSGYSFGESHPPGSDIYSVLDQNPQLTSSTDFRPVAGSPAIGTGMNLSSEVTTDFLNAVRTGEFDIGAFQH